MPSYIDIVYQNETVCLRWFQFPRPQRTWPWHRAAGSGRDRWFFVCCTQSCGRPDQSDSGACTPLRKRRTVCSVSPSPIGSTNISARRWLGSWAFGWVGTLSRPIESTPDDFQGLDLPTLAQRLATFFHLFCFKNINYSLVKLQDPKNMYTK